MRLLQEEHISNEESEINMIELAQELKTAQAEIMCLKILCISIFAVLLGCFWTCLCISKDRSRIERLLVNEMMRNNRSDDERGGL